jgi:hypothetical protein
MGWKMSDVKYIIKHLLEENTTESWTEAICIALSQLKDKEGKALRVFLSKDYGEHIERCMQIAKTLRGEK